MNCQAPRSNQETSMNLPSSGFRSHELYIEFITNESLMYSLVVIKTNLVQEGSLEFPKDDSVDSIEKDSNKNTP